MCGITGFASRYGRISPPPSVARAMCATLHHRGPDDEGLFHADHAFIGMRRLAIIDPAGGHQPFVSEDGRVHAVVNGEIYNYRELRRALEGKGHRFQTDSDAECVLHGYEEHGPDIFRRLRGMFAAAVWDADTECLVLARDRFGKKPLYYADTSVGLYFSSELKTFGVIPRFQPEINTSMVPAYLMLGYVPTPESMLAGVRKLPPGHHLVYHRGATLIERYWQLPFEPKFDEREDQLLERLESVVDDAVAARLVSDVPFGAFLSGGVDSGLVVSLMARHLSQPVQTYTIGFEEDAFNEAQTARRVAEHIGTDHTEVVLKPDPPAIAESLACFIDEPLADSSAIPTFLVSRLAASRVKMVLSGDGGDEMFGGYDRYRRYLLLRMLQFPGHRPTAAAMAAVLGMVPASTTRRLGRICTRLSLAEPDDYLSGVAIALPREIRNLLSPDLAIPARGFGVLDRFHPCEAGLTPLDRTIRGDIGTYLLDDILAKVDRMSMANSLEVRSPLLDQHVAEFAARLPVDMKIRGNEGKYLLKQLARRNLPADVVDRPKHGFAIPLSEWLRGDLRELLHDTLSADSFNSSGVFQTQNIRHLAAQHQTGRRDHGELLWAVLIFELWRSRLFESRATIPSAEPEQRLSAHG
ncbi:MAG: asparagine synthase (glutamine-hydrolyzing) [Gammaproteobacteria bacterium]